MKHILEFTNTYPILTTLIGTVIASLIGYKAMKKGNGNVLSEEIEESINEDGSRHKKEKRTYKS